MRGVEG